MKHSIRIALASLAWLAFMGGCGDQDHPALDGGTDADLDAEPPYSGPAVVRGQVLTPVGERFQPVAGAVLWLDGGPSVVTDDTGMFEFGGLQAGEAILLHVGGPDVNGRHVEARVVYGTTHVWVRPDELDNSLFPKLLLGCWLVVDGDEAQLVALDRCGAGAPIEVDLPAGAFVFADDGSTHTGPIRIEVAVVDPSRGATFAGLPPPHPDGDPAEQPEVIGGAELRFYDAVGGSPLRVAEGQTIGLRLPVGEPSATDGVPDVVLSWYDDVEGRWSDDGTSALVGDPDGGRYVAVEATHLSAVRASVSSPGPARGCLALWPTMEPLEIPCRSDVDCPEGPNGLQRPCDGQVCGCAVDNHCPNDAVCDTASKRCVPFTCSSSSPCRDGLNARTLSCDLGTGTCGCQSSFQCAGDRQCVDNSCRQLNAEVDVFVDGRYWRTYSGLRGCRIVPHDRDLTLHARYVNPLAILTGLSPVYEWQSGTIRRPPLTDDELDAPDGFTPMQWACATAPGCDELLVGGDRVPPVLRAQRLTCVGGQLWAACEAGLCTPQPVGGLVHVRQAGTIVGAGLAEPDGRFCATYSAASSDLELTRGWDYPGGSYLTGSFEPDPTVPAGARCPNPSDGAWPTGDCQDLGVVDLRCHPGDTSTNCMEADFTVDIDYLEGRDYRVSLDASSSIGAAYYQWEVFSGLLTSGRFLVSEATTDPTWEFEASGYRTYTVRLAVTTDFTRWDARSRTIALHDEAHIPTSRLWIGEFDPHQYFHWWVYCDDDADCGSGQRCFDELCSWPCELDDDCPRRYFCGDDDVCHYVRDRRSSPLALPVEVPEFWISRTETTQAQFAACIAADACTEPAECEVGAWDPRLLPNHPVVCTTFDQARAYCEWRGRRLPTELEWELAARGAYQTSGLICGGGLGFQRADRNDVFAWGNEPTEDCDYANALLLEPPMVTPELELVEACDGIEDCDGDEQCIDGLCTVNACARHADCPEGTVCADGRCFDDDYVSCVGRLVPVGSHPDGASPFGVLDMAGNAAEWVADWYLEDHYLAVLVEEVCGHGLWLSCLGDLFLDPAWAQNPAGPTGGVERVIRGGSAVADEEGYLRSYYRDHGDPERRSPFLGFRCAIGSQDLLDCDFGDCTFEDCNENGFPDECDVGIQSRDCNANAIPDECDLDAGLAADSNGDGIIDACEGRRCPAGLQLDVAIGATVEYCSGWRIPGGELPMTADPQLAVIVDASYRSLPLVTGGRGATEVSNAAFLFDKDDVSFARAADMNEARAQHSMTPMGDFQALVVGGLDNDGNALASAEIYDGYADAWTPTTPMPDARYGHVAAALSPDRVLVVGGRDQDGATLYDGVIYTSHGGGHWTNAFGATEGLSALPMDATSALPMLPGAMVAGLDAGSQGRVAIFDLNGGTWYETASPPAGPFGFPIEMDEVGGWTFFFGGLDDNGEPANVALAYRPESDVPGFDPWLSYPPMSEGRYTRALAYIEQYVWEFMAIGGAGPNYDHVEVYRFNPGPTGWWQTVPMSHGHWGEHLAVTTHQRNPVQVLVVGGYEDPTRTTISPPEVYTRTWPQP